MHIGKIWNERRRVDGFHILACKACGAEWQSEPALKVACTECHARPGEPCSWRKPHSYAVHICRDLLAMREGHLSACGALTWDGRHSRQGVITGEQLPLNAASVPHVAEQPRQLGLF